MATEAEATREARAKVIAAEGEQKASMSLKQAADVIKSRCFTVELFTNFNNSCSRKKCLYFPINWT